jgi:hypothetical protein
MQTLLRFRGYIITSLVWIIILGLYVAYDRWPRPETIVIETPGSVRNYWDHPGACCRRRA